MRFLLRLFLITLVGLPATAAILAYSEQADIRITVPATRDDLNRIKERIKDFRRVDKDQDLVITQRELDLLLQQGLEGRSRLRVRSSVQPGEMELRFTQPLPGKPPAAYLNFGIRLEQSADFPTLVGVRLGEVELPTWLFKPMDSLLKLFVMDRAGDFPLATFNDQVRMLPGRLEVDAELPRNLREAGGQWLTSDQEKARLADYYAVLNRLTRKVPPLTSQSLSGVLKGMFLHAQGRTRLSDDPVAENRSLLTVLGVYLVGGNPARELGFTALVVKQPRLPKMRLTLHGRRDLAQHFGISAAIAAHAGSLLADVAGFGKEMNDSRGGSGFSFADLAADRAGNLLGRLATEDARQALRLQKQAGGLRSESDVIPDIGRLPEGLSEARLERDLGGVDGARFNALEREIERRLKTCRVYL